MPPLRHEHEDCANRLLATFMYEWLEQAKERNSKGVTTYRKAYNSLVVCPMPFKHPSEAIKLQGLGEKLCSRLTKRLEEYCEENGLPMPQKAHKHRKRKAAASDEEDNEGEEEQSPPKKKRTAKPYVPALRSGAYGIILALATLDEHATSVYGLTKPELIRLAQPHCDSSFSAPSDPTKFYTAWNSMKTLLDKDLVYEKGRPTRKYMLTEEGWDVAKRIKKSSDPSQGRMGEFVSSNRPAASKQKNEDDEEDDFYDLEPSQAVPLAASQSSRRKSPAAAPAPGQEETTEDIIPVGEAITDESALPTFSPIILEPGSFTVELVLDNREIRAREDRDYMALELKKKGVKPLVRTLDLGDALWVARMHDPDLLARKGAEGEEILLDYIVERKRLDDLVSSIKDGRFHEQKFRLKRSGVKNIIYLIEEISVHSDHFDKNNLMIESAIASTQVVSGFFVKKTQKMDDTIKYLVSVTKMLKEKYESKPLHLIPTKVLTSQNHLPLLSSLAKKHPSTTFNITYKAFASMSSKSETLTLRDVYLKMLMCTKGITGEKALEIQKRWKTPIEFIEAYKRIGEDNSDEIRKRKMKFVSDEMGGLVGRKKIARALSVKIAEVWGGLNLDGDD